MEKENNTSLGEKKFKASRAFQGSLLLLIAGIGLAIYFAPVTDTAVGWTILILFSLFVSCISHLFIYLKAALKLFVKKYIYEIVTEINEQDAYEKKKLEEEQAKENEDNK